MPGPAASENEKAMNSRMCVVMAGVTIWWVFGAAGCAPYLPPVTVPETHSPALESFRTALKTIDCGVFWRTVDAAAKPVDATTLAWQEACRLATASRVPLVTGR